MEDVFPHYKVRLIAINDNYDSLNPRTDADEIIIPFKNLINEQYLRDSSLKIRSGLNIRRKNGDFVAAFAPYGYRRDGNNRYKLVIDEHAADVVRCIFRQKLEGMSRQKIAGWLNETGEASPAEYKKRNTRYIAPFQKNVRASWSAVAVGRILQNPVYTGVMVQGKQTTPSYKVKRRIEKPENEWYIVGDTHEPIISKLDFEIVRDLLGQDTRTAPEQEIVYPLSGLVYCGDCGNNMIRTKSNGRQYYICASSRGKNKSCTSHCIRHEKLEQAVINTTAQQIALFIDINKSLAYVKRLPSKQQSIKKINIQIADRENEIKNCDRYKRSLYGDYRNGIISKDDYTAFGKEYSRRIKEMKKAVSRLNKEVELRLVNDRPAINWLENFIHFRNVPDFSRQLSVKLIKRVEVWNESRISIHLRCFDGLEPAGNILKAMLAQEAEGV